MAAASRWTALPSRATWHKHALQDAALRDMPLHALRHTAAAWLAGHLERRVLAEGAAATEEAIVPAVREHGANRA